MLYVVPTPIGNLKDIGIRSLEILTQVDLILAEDTRTSSKLLKHYEISTPLRSYHIHNEHHVVKDLVEKLKDSDMALITDAGTPGISDPGFLLIRECIKEGIELHSVPGATAFVPALNGSGLSTDKFFFEGFLPTKKGRKTRLEFLSAMENTFILYESPHRIKRCIKELILHCGPDRKACVSRELTKMHEEVIRGTLTELENWSNKKEKIKGEIVVCVAGTKNN